MHLNKYPHAGATAQVTHKQPLSSQRALQSMAFKRGSSAIPEGIADTRVTYSSLLVVNLHCVGRTLLAHALSARSAVVARLQIPLPQLRRADRTGLGILPVFFCRCGE